MTTQKTGTKPPDEFEIAGRKVQRVNDMENMKETLRNMPGYTGNPVEGDPDKIPPVTAEQKAAVAALIPEFLREEAQQETQQSAPRDDSAKLEAINMIGDRLVRARKEGDDKLAANLHDVLDGLVGNDKTKRVRVKRDLHPVLQKLKRNLGLEKIAHITVEWADMKWHFAPAPPAVDHWVANMSSQGLGLFSGLKVSANLVGIDDVPLYEVFHIDLVAEFQPPTGEPILAPIFDKICDACGETLPADATKCATCGSLHDPFDMPLALRLRCADRVHRFFMEEFGPYESLDQLYKKMRAQMPDRVSDKEALYGPFLDPEPSLEPSTTSSEPKTTSPSGDAP